MNNTKRIPDNLLRKGKLSTVVAAEPTFDQWFDRLVQDERWQAEFHRRLTQRKLAEIEF